jgi:hypothetical protein
MYYYQFPENKKNEFVLMMCCVLLCSACMFKHKVNWEYKLSWYLEA